MPRIYRPVASQSLRIRWSFSAYGTEPSSYGANYYRAPAGCCGEDCPGFVQFATSPESYYQNNVCQVNYDHTFDSVNETFTGDITDQGYNISNYCNVCDRVKFNYWFQTNIGNNISSFLGYVGKTFWVQYKPINSEDGYVFRIEGGTIDNYGKVTSPFGRIYFCGTAFLTSGGLPLYTIDRIDGNYVELTYNDVSHETEPLYMRRPDPYHAFCGGYLNVAESSRIFVFWSEDDFPKEDDDDCICTSCYADIESCCNDEQFTSDLNEFSSLKSPDTYINPDSGEEERIPYNGCLHISRILEIGFKTFYALVFHIVCTVFCKVDKAQSTNDEIATQLKRIADILEEKEMSVDVSVSDKSNVEYDTFNGRIQDKINDEEGFWNG